MCVTLCMEDSVTYILVCMTRVCVWCYLFIRVTWLVYMCDVTRWCVWRASLICVTFCMEDSVTNILVHMTCVCVWRYWFIRVTWLVGVCDVTRLYLWLYLTVVCRSKNTGEVKNTENSYYGAVNWVYETNFWDVCSIVNWVASWLVRITSASKLSWFVITYLGAVRQRRLVLFSCVNWV